MDLWLLIVTCPRTGVDINTGFAMSKAVLDSSSLANIPVKCEACGRRHLWGKDDVRLKKASERVPGTV